MLASINLEFFTRSLERAPVILWKCSRERTMPGFRVVSWENHFITAWQGQLIDQLQFLLSASFAIVRDSHLGLKKCEGEQLVLVAEAPLILKTAGALQMQHQWN